MKVHAFELAVGLATWQLLFRGDVLIDSSFERNMVTSMKIRESVVSLCFVCPRPPEDKKNIQYNKTVTKK